MHTKLKTTIRGLALAGLASILMAGSALAEVSEVRITRQPGLVWIPMIIAEREGLIQKHARELGLPDLTTTFVTISGGGAANEALLSGNVDMVMTGTTNMLLLNDRTRGQVKGFFGIGGTPLKLLTRNPNVQKLEDFSQADRIAVPTIKTSMQALMLQIAAKEQLGNAEALDNITVQLGHPDAFAALSNPSSEVNSHFSLPPFQQRAMAIEGVHQILNSYELVGQNVSNAVVFGNVSFAEENPTVIRAIVAALEEANTMIEERPEEAAQSWIEASNETIPVEEVVEILKDPGTFFSQAPQGQMLVANHFYETGVIRTEPTDWKNYYIEAMHERDGN